jgi:hypothetical protein
VRDANRVSARCCSELGKQLEYINESRPPIEANNRSAAVRKDTTTTVANGVFFDVGMVLGNEWHFLQRPEAMRAMEALKSPLDSTVCSRKVKL